MEGDYSDTEEHITEIVETDDSRYSTLYHISKVYSQVGPIVTKSGSDEGILEKSRELFNFHRKYVGCIVGSRGHTKNKIEQDTKTELKIPGHGQDGNITILGPTADSVKAAMRQIHTIVVSSRLKQRPTHFVSIPLSQPGVVENFTRFQEAVLRDCQNRGLHESIFIKPSKIHLTMGVMCLTDDEEKVLASNLLKEAKEKVVIPLIEEHLPLNIRIKGLSFMDHDPENMNVLYAKVEEFECTPGILQQMADGIVQYFGRKGLMRKEEYGLQNVKLHVTLLNTMYRRRSSQDQDFRAWRKRTPFDGSDILAKYGDFDFGVLEVKEIHLSQRDAVGPDGYYKPTFVVPIP